MGLRETAGVGKQGDAWTRNALANLQKALEKSRRGELKVDTGQTTNQREPNIFDELAKGPQIEVVV